MNNKTLKKKLHKAHTRLYVGNPGHARDPAQGIMQKKILCRVSCKFWWHKTCHFLKKSWWHKAPRTRLEVAPWTIHFAHISRNPVCFARPGFISKPHKTAQDQNARNGKWGSWGTKVRTILLPA